MNFKEAFNNDCQKITASDELRNRTLMAATTLNKEDKVMKKADKTKRNKKTFKLPVICTAFAVAVVAIVAIIFNSNLLNMINNKSHIKTPGTLKVYAGENHEEITKKGISINKFNDTAIGSYYSASFSELKHTTGLLFDLNLQVEDNDIKNIKLYSSDDNALISVKTSDSPDNIKNEDYYIPQRYFDNGSYFPFVKIGNDQQEKFILGKCVYANFGHEYSDNYNDFKHIYLFYVLTNINSINTTLTITVEYNDGTVVSKNYSATAYLSENYLFIREVE